MAAKGRDWGSELPDTFRSCTHPTGSLWRSRTQNHPDRGHRHSHHSPGPSRLGWSCHQCTSGLDRHWWNTHPTRSPTAQCTQDRLHMDHTRCRHSPGPSRPDSLCHRRTRQDGKRCPGKQQKRSRPTLNSQVRRHIWWDRDHHSLGPSRQTPRSGFRSSSMSPRCSNRDHSLCFPHRLPYRVAHSHNKTHNWAPRSRRHSRHHFG